MARPMRCRTRNLNLCPLVQHKPPTPRPGCHRTPTSRKPTCNNAKESGLNAPTRDPGLGRPIKRLHHAGTAPVAGRYTLYGALHPIRTGALPTDRVQHPRAQAQSRTKPPRTQTSTQRQQTEHNETTTAPARVADDTPCRAMLPSYRIKGLTPFEYNLHRTRAQTRKRT